MSENGRIIVLRVIKYSESDLVLHTLSSSGERLNFLALGALRSKKRFGGGVLEATHLLQVQFKRARQFEGLNTLQEAELLEGHSSLRTDYDRLSMALYFLRLIDVVTMEGSVGDESLFNLLGNSLQALRFTKNLTGLKSQFEVKLLKQQGVLPATFERRDVKSILSQHMGGRDELLK